MTTPAKLAIVEELTAKMRNAVAVYFTDFTGLSAPKATELRAKLREANIEFTVAKKTLSRRAAKEAGFGEIDAFMQGLMALALTYDDPTSPARILREFSKSNQDVPVITGLILDGQLFPADRAGELAHLPSKDVLLGQLVGILQQPLARLASTLARPVAKLAQILSGIKE